MGGLRDLPEGPVTIMFTDIEGSTALRTRLGDADADALFRQHDELVRERIAAHQGHDQQAALGDGFLAVFVSTRRAVACAIAIQKAFDSWNRNRSGPAINVRIGLNTGEVDAQGGQLSGEAVHAAARVCAAASGGQILVSDVTRQLAGTLADVTFHDRGEFELKGFPQPWHLWEVVWVRETTATPQPVFVGRDAELAQLRTSVLDALDGRGGLVLVGGEPGVGKTTLVKQLIREAEQRGALALFGRCYESEGQIPYAPFVEMLEQALAIMPPELVRQDLADDAAEVARMVPALRRRFPDIDDPLDLPPEQQRRYFFNAVGSFVARASARFPLVLVIDDIHWADEPTLLLTEHMASLMPELRVLGVGTYRDVELDVSRPLATTIERLVRERLVERMPVRRFDRQTMATMIQALAGMAPPDVVVDAIYSETEGNPFFVEEVYRHLVEDGRLFDADGSFRADLDIDELDVPESVRLVVGRRLQRLGEHAQRILAAGAVVGRAFPFRLLDEVVDADSGEVIDVLDAAEAARVVVAEEREGDVHYAFGHELIRQTLLSGLSALRRQRLHLAVADAIERTDRRARQDRPSEIAAHLLQAGAAATPDRTLGYLELAAERAFDAAAFEEALRWIDDALAIVDPDDALRRAALDEKRGRVVGALGRFDEGVRIWDSVIDCYAEHGLRDRAAELCGERGYQFAWLNRFEEAYASFARGLAIVGDEPTATRAMLLGRSAGIVGLAGFYDASEKELQEAEAIARDLGDQRALGVVLWNRCMSEWSNGRPRESISSGRAAIDAMRRANDPWTLVDALGWTSFPLIACGRPDEINEGRAMAEEATELGQRLGHRGGEVLGVRGRVITWGWTGDAETLERAARTDLEAFVGIQSPWAATSHVFLAGALMLRGDLDAALDHAREATELEPRSAWTGGGWAYELLVHAWRGDADRIREMLADKRATFPPPGTRPTMGTFFMVLNAVQACVVAGLRAEAADLYGHAVYYVDHLPCDAYTLALPERVAGMAAAAAEQWDDAERWFETALRRAEEIPDRLDQPQVEYWYAEMLLDRGGAEDRARARELLESAVARFDDLGMPLHLERARSRLAQLPEVG